MISLPRWALVFCCASAMVPMGSRPARAGLVFYTSEAAFDAASSPLATQTFAMATVPAIGVGIIGNPLNSMTNNAVFQSGSILPNMSISSSVENAGQDLGVVASGVFGNTNTAIYNNYGGNALDTTFGSPITSVGMALLNPNGSSVTFTVDSPSGTAIGVQTVTVNAAGSSTFFGVIATGGTQIGEVELLGHATNGKANQGFAGFDRLVFNSPSSTVPEPASLILLGLGTASLLAWRVARK